MQNVTNDGQVILFFLPLPTQVESKNPARGRPSTFLLVKLVNSSGLFGGEEREEEEEAVYNNTGGLASPHKRKPTTKTAGQLDIGRPLYHLLSHTIPVFIIVVRVFFFPQFFFFFVKEMDIIKMPSASSV